MFRGFSLHSNVSTLIFAIAYGVGIILYNSLIVKMSGMGPLSVMSMFSTLGAIVVIVIVGFVFLHEKVTVLKVLAVLFAALSFLPLIIKNKGKEKKISLKFFGLCMVVFAMNGLFAILSKFAQMYSDKIEDTVDWVALYLFFGILTSAAIAIPSLAKSTQVEREHVFSVKSIIFALLAIGSNTVGAISNLYLASMFEASVQFPVYCTGFMVLTTVIAFIMYKEKPDRNMIISLALAILSVVAFSLPF